MEASSSSAVPINQSILEEQLPGLTQDVSARNTYRYWRTRIMYSLIFGYATFYLVRLNFSMAIPAICEEFGYTKTKLGVVVSLFSVIYGGGKFINGYLSDRSNARYFMTIGLVGSAIVNIFMGFGSSIFYFSIFWAINAWFQSMAWPPCGRLLTHWFAPKELGTKWGLWNSSHQIGGAAIFILAGILIVNFGWRTAFFVPAGFALLVSFVLFNRLRDTPSSLGLPSVEVYKGIAERDDDEDYLTDKELIYRVLSNKLLWYVCIGNMFLYIVRIGVFTWAPTFLKELKGSSILTSGWQTAGFEIGGLFGGLCAGWLSDKVFHGRRGPVSVIYMIALVLALLYFWKVPHGHVALNALSMVAVGFMVYGPQVLVGVAAADFSSKKAVGMATGLTGVFGYIGGAISGIGVGYIADNWGWDGGFMFFILCAMLGAVFFALTWKHRAKVLERKL
jgi:phosphoglycerate transporter family protein